MFIEKNYRLSNGNYFHFHETDDGYDYSLYDDSGNLIDGGVLEYDNSTNSSLSEVLNKLSNYTELPELLNPDIQEVDKEIIEDFEELQYRRNI